VNKAFTPKMVHQMSENIEQTVHELLDRLSGKQTVDLVEEFAVPLPLSIISDMLGVGDDDRDQFHAWMRRFTESSSGTSAWDLLRALPTAREMMQMFERLAQQRRTDPDDGLISALVRANDEGDVLSDQEVLAMMFLLLLAGHDTTANLIGNSVLALLDNPDQLESLRSDPSIIDTAVEDLLRYTSPVPCGVIRTTLEDVEIAGAVVTKGSPVLGMIISANRDEAMFDGPDILNLRRQPNRHIAFAFGSHYCLGNQLARIEGRIALNAFVQRFGDIQLAVPREQLRWKATESLRGLRALPLTLR
jgi:cytochrome P450 PksS